MAEKSIIVNLESRVRQLIVAHEKLASLCAELKAECTKLRAENRQLEEQNRSLKSDLARRELAESLTGESKNRDKARVRVNRLMREVDACIALVGRLENDAARQQMKEE